MNKKKISLVVIYSFLMNGNNKFNFDASSAKIGRTGQWKSTKQFIHPLIKQVKSLDMI